jgi:hypothetical protein
VKIPPPRDVYPIRSVPPPNNFMAPHFMPRLTARHNWRHSINFCDPTTNQTQQNSAIKALTRNKIPLLHTTLQYIFDASFKVISRHLCVSKLLLDSINPNAACRDACRFSARIYRSPHLFSSSPFNLLPSTNTTRGICHPRPLKVRMLHKRSKMESNAQK